MGLRKLKKLLAAKYAKGANKCFFWFKKTASLPRFVLNDVIFNNDLFAPFAYFSAKIS